MTKSVLLLAGDEYEDLELQYPLMRLREASMRPVVAGQAAGVQHRGKYGYPVVTDRAFDDIDPEAFAGIIAPGGWMPDKLRRDDSVLGLMRAFDRDGKLIASICHGGWICISASVVSGRNYTGSRGIKDDLQNAGAVWHDEAVVVDGHHVSSRSPADLPQFMAAVLRILVEGPG